MKNNSLMPRKLSGKLRPLLTASALASALVAAGIGTAFANPHGHHVVSGDVTFSRQGNVFTITNSPNAIIDWRSFSIRPGQTTQFIQQSSSSTVLNRITGQNPSQIFGTLASNGHFFLINPNGVIFGAGSQVNVAGLVASSLAITNADFLAGKNRFTAGSMAGNVSNNGNITTSSGGQVFLIAPNVANNGVINSPGGEVLLAAGHSVELADSTNPSLHVVVSAPADQAINLGQVVTQGGQIGIYGALVNQRGTLNANSAVVGENGKIVLRASGATLLEAGSVTTATGIDTGGEIQALGQQVGLIGDAGIDASGQNGGGTVLIGGNYQGKNPAVMNAQQVYVAKDASIRADAIVRGDGGKVIAWGEQTTQAYGAISVHGGAQSGNGGFVETSAHYLDVAGIRVNATAAHGRLGKWLLDPRDIIISSGDDPSDLANSATFAANADATSFINPAQFLNIGANVTLQATNNITFGSAVTFNTPNVGLTAQAGNNIEVNASITTHGGALVLSANDNGGGTALGTGRVNVNSGVILATNGGTLAVRDSTTPVISAPTLQSCLTNPSQPGCTTSPPPQIADICTIAPNSALCQILSPTQASEPVKPTPVSQAINTTVNVINTQPAGSITIAMYGPASLQIESAPATPSASSTLSSGGSSSGSGSTSAPAPDKADDKKVASNTPTDSKSGVKNEPVPKMYCN
jgi:filamentous hemagglutinin family protein